MNYKITAPEKPIECEINLPSSKSISNRLLIIKALCRDKIILNNLSDANDTKVLKQALESDSNVVNISDSGTALRFLTSYFSIQKEREVVLTGTKRIQERPIKELVDTLKILGAEIEYLKDADYAPLKIKGSMIYGGKISIDGSISSQFISALLLIAPTLKYGLTIEIKNSIVSRSYIKTTLMLMKEFGVNHTWQAKSIHIDPQNYCAKNYTIEADWSAASFWYEIAALSKKCKIKLNGLSEQSYQGDSKSLEIFLNLGVCSYFKNTQLILKKNKKSKPLNNIDILNTPDIYPALKCTLFGLDLNPRITGIQTLKNKESDRLKSIENELQKLTTIKIIETYNDHRIAMGFAPLSLKYGQLMISNIGVVAKSYPHFWEDLSTAGFTITPSTH